MNLKDSVTIYDFEVFTHDWLVVFKRLSDGCYFVFHNDPEGVAAYMLEQVPLLCGFNNKHYDNFILKTVLMGLEPEMVKQVNDQIIVHGVPGWSIPFLRDSGIWFQSFDLMDDMQQGLSLKAIEAHLGMDIEESEVSFNLDRSLTEKELEQTEHYCRYDVDATEKLFELRQSYLENKIAIGTMAGLSASEALYMTNPKLTATYLQAKRPEKFWADERNYQYPDQLLMEYIPQEAIDYFDRLHDETISMEEIMGTRLDLTVGDCPVTLGFGGIHGALPNYREDTTETRVIRNADVASYYPNLMRCMGYCSRAMPNAQMYADIITRRVAAKKAGDKETADALKLVLNSTYGGMLNGHGEEAFNDLYDPLMARSVCISGQLFLLELTQHLVRECPTLKVIQLNTDGIMVSFDLVDEPAWKEICQEWQDRTGFELEEDRIQRIVQKDVNNYIEVQESGKVKVKGGQLVRGISTAGAFNINNNARVVSKAILNYFTDGIDPKDTVYEDGDVLDFMLIAKASGKYSGVYQECMDEMIPVQRCNRVYASINHQTFGTLYKVHAETGRAAKIAGLPAHCYVDNKNILTLEKIDRDWYVRLARKYIRDFQGIEGPKVNTRRVNSLMKKCLEVIDKVGQKELF